MEHANERINEDFVSSQQLFMSENKYRITMKQHQYQPEDEFPRYDLPPPPPQELHNHEEEDDDDRFHGENRWSSNQVYGGGVHSTSAGSNFDSFDAFPYGSCSSLNVDCFEYECKPFSDINIGYMNFHNNNNNNYFDQRNLMVGSSSSHNNQMLNQEEAEMIKPAAATAAVMMNSDELNLYNNNHQCDQHYLKSSNNNTHLSTRRSGSSPATATKKTWKGRKKNNVVKGQWTVDEDRILVQLVEQYGIRKWSHIAQMLPGRIGKQCRERWHNHLRPDIKKDTWTEEEDKVLIQSHAEIGNKWAEIAKSLPGRTENSIKNHWNATKRRQYSKRKCRSKYPRDSILQDYIKSLNLDSTSAAANSLIPSKRSSSSPTIPNKANSSLLDDHYQQDDLSENDRLVPTFYYNNEEVPDFGFDGCNLDSLLDGLPPIVDDKSFDDLDVPIEDQQASTVVPLLRDDFEVKKELDLVEMMSVTKKLGFF